jgi:ribonuclease VapC
VIADTSAIVAIVRDEPERADFIAALTSVPRPAMSAASYLEAAIVIDAGRDPVSSAQLDRLLETVGMELTPVTASQARIARQAYRDYGRGSGHPARLNLGDCFAYALAIETDEPLLYKGDDFGHTDVRRVRFEG